MPWVGSRMAAHPTSPLLVPLAAPASLLFEAAVRLRNRLYDTGILRQRELPHPVLSVGNLTVGGSGKTPLVIHLARVVSCLGSTPVLLSRGYGRKSKSELVIAPGEMTGADADLIGDEPALIRRHIPGLWMGISPRRWEAGMQLASRAPNACFILDDGFQHRSLKRDLDILVIDRLQPLGTNRVLPRGSLREPAAAIRRADIVVINGAPSAGTPDSVEEDVRNLKPNTTIYHCIQEITGLVPFANWHKCEPESQGAIDKSPVFLVAAIGNPDRFRRDVETLGMAINGSRFIRDHSSPTAADWESFAARARSLGARSLVITEKDAVKIRTVPDFPVLVAVQSIRVREQEELQDRLRRIREADR